MQKLHFSGIGMLNPIQKRIYEEKGGTRWLTETKKAGLHFYNQPLEGFDGAWVTFKGRRMLNFASYSYLNLLGHPEIAAAAQEATKRYGTGTHGVRIMSGTLPLHEELERTIAKLYKTEAAILCPSGYAANTATLSALVGRNDIVICDKYNHASIVDGCLLSQAKLARFRHNDIADLERQLKQVNPDIGRLVVVDAVFSMDGDISDIPEISRLCRKYNAFLMVDEAHSLGTLGKKGHGIEEHFGLQKVIDIKMGTLSKAIPSMGGYVAGSQELIDYLKHSARAFIFSAPLSPAQTAAAQASFDIMEREPERVKNLQRNANLCLSGIKALGFDTLNSETPIVPIICGEDNKAFKMAKLCHEGGIYVLPVVSPVVPNGLARLRVTVTAAHSKENIDSTLAVIAKAGKAIGLIE
jgi:8-amino-7-oxononanoate synthase